MKKKERKKMSEKQNKQIGALTKLLSHRAVFLLHAFFYTFVNLLLILIWGVSGGGIFWPAGAIFGWGIGFALHLVTYLAVNDKVEFLSKIKEEGNMFRISFVYHVTLYASVMILLIMIDIVSIPISGFTGGWVLSLIVWGVLIVIHGLGFSTWNKKVEEEIRSIKEEHPKFSEKRLNAVAKAKIANTWILLIHIGLFAIVTLFQYILWSVSFTPDQMLNQNLNTIQWALILAIHIVVYALKYYIKLKSNLKILIGNFAAYVVISVFAVVRNLTIDDTPINYWQFPVILLGIWILILVIITLIWDKLLKTASERISSKYSNLEDFEVSVKATGVIFWEWSFLAHILIYLVGILLLNNILTSLGLNIIYFPAMGWLIGLAVHGAIVFIVWKPIKNLFTASILIHLATYIVGSIFLLGINLMYVLPEFLWSVIAMGGWGLGLGIHIFIRILMKK
jgi:hypothetical protein